MTPTPTPARPGAMTVPFTFGWQGIAVVVAVVVLVGVVAFVALAAGRAASGRAEWQAWLDGRSAPPAHLSAGDGDDGSGPSGTPPQSAYRRR